MLRRFLLPRPSSPNAGASPVNSTPDVEQAWKVLHLINDWIRHADAKAGVTLAFVGALGAVLYSLASDFVNRHLLFDALVVVACGALVIAGVCSGMTLAPRTKGPKADESETEVFADSLIYFGSIARNYANRQNKYIRDLNNLTADNQALITNIAHQVYVNAGIADVKSLWAKRAIFSTLFSGGLIATIAIVVGVSNS